MSMTMSGQNCEGQARDNISVRHSAAHAAETPKEPRRPLELVLRNAALGSQCLYSNREFVRLQTDSC
jgi:hypothetical protein